MAIGPCGDSVAYCPTRQQLADGLTKPLQRGQFGEWVDRVRAGDGSGDLAGAGVDAERPGDDTRADGRPPGDEMPPTAAIAEAVLADSAVVDIDMRRSTQAQRSRDRSRGNG